MTKEKRLIATNKTEEERDRLTEVWKKRIVSEKGFSVSYRHSYFLFQRLSPLL